MHCPPLRILQSSNLVMWNRWSSYRKTLEIQHVMKHSEKLLETLYKLYIHPVISTEANLKVRKLVQGLSVGSNLIKKNRILRKVTAICLEQSPGDKLVFFINGIDGFTAVESVWRQVLIIAKAASIEITFGVVESYFRLRLATDFVTPLKTDEFLKKVSQGWNLIPDEDTPDQNPRFCALFNLEDMIQSFDLSELSRPPLHHAFITCWRALEENRELVKNALKDRYHGGRNRG
ncbi:MAG: hypothetical protein HETSPECPRED_001383 [Heterodermia speciosa]|uniref:Uncharacterized protein n=1 Tax=Heterodermia speciosa TaxID=116794 RepID=A0A8H3PES3_9LECA|nr:MAG: hypothetical protein HETSPECPRED_001383 [Heterodermia speciosa]